MSYESVPIAQYCSYSGCKHLSGVSFCQNCGSGWAKIIDLSETSPCTNRGESSQPTVSMQQPIQPALHVAALQWDIVNNHLKAVQNTHGNAGMNALSTRPPNGPCMTSQPFSFTFVLILESFYYASEEDQEYDLSTIITRKHIGM